MAGNGVTVLAFDAPGKTRATTDSVAESKDTFSGL
jgi:hypothetical protein